MSQTTQDIPFGSGVTPPPLPHPGALSSPLEKMLGEMRMAVWRWDPELDQASSSRLMAELWGLLPGQSLRDSRLGFALIHPDDREAHRERVRRAVERGEGWHAEFRIVRPCDGRVVWIEERSHATVDPVTGRRVYDGIAWDISERKRAELERAFSERKYRTLFDSIDEGFALVEVLYDDSGRAVDLLYRETNPAFERHAGIDMLGRRALEAIPEYERYWIDQYDRVARTGEVVRGEHPVRGLADNWFRYAAFRYGAAEGNLVGVVFANVTDLKKTERAREEFSTRLEREVNERTSQLKESRDLLQSVLDTSLVGMAYMQADRKPDGSIRDFVIRMTNREMERETGRADLVGKRYAEEYPGIRVAGLFNAMLRVLDTGVPETLEYYYPHEGMNKWYSSMFVKFEDGIVATNLDISRQKKVEADLKNALAVLEIKNRVHAYAEEIAAMGTWTWNTQTGVFSFSDNLFRLFGLEPGEIVPGPGDVERFIHPEDRERVLQSTALLQRNGHRPAPLEYRVIRKDGALRHFIDRVQKVSDLEGGHLLVGITEDITERKQEEEHTRRLRVERLLLEERQRLELLATTLNTQEAERKRISESLHNGIGQMLYGIQLNLTQITLAPGDTWEARHERQQRRTIRLLGDAIEEARRVSHELMPSVIEDFGLKVALDDLCRQYHGAFDLDCHLEELEGEPARYVQLAIYRIVQELVTNIVKHAEATRARLRVARGPGHYRIEVSDDGKGFDPEARSTGIGLKTLEDKVRLLKGTVEIDSGAQGTTVRILLPYAAEIAAA